MLGVAFFLYPFLSFTWFGYRHILDKSILKDETTDLFFTKGRSQPSPKRGDFEYNHFIDLRRGIPCI